jgi:Endonuclease/Exonuclease/phosphatase family
MAHSPLRIATWNCNGALRKKWQTLEPLDADVLVVQECEDPARSSDDAYLHWSGKYLWTGASKHKGIAVFVREGVTLERVPLDLEQLRLFLPCLVNGAPLLAAWTMRSNSRTFGYIGQLWKFLETYKTFLDHPRGLLLGDLNSNVQWDFRDRWCNHSNVVRDLGELGLRSAYHQHLVLPQGNEPDPTFYLHRNLQKPYHIDYAFTGKAWSVNDVQIGQARQWLTYSDHMPLWCQLAARQL